MSSPFTFGVAPKAEVLTFKQRGGESLKDAWYRINDSQVRATKKQSRGRRLVLESLLMLVVVALLVVLLLLSFLTCF